MSRIVLGFVSASVLAAAPAQATETVNHSYDALGRLSSTTRAGGPNSGVNTTITYDPAGNRSAYSTSGTSAGFSSQAMTSDSRMATDLDATDAATEAPSVSATDKRGILTDFVCQNGGSRLVGSSKVKCNK
jgi:hypothetical protein